MENSPRTIKAVVTPLATSSASSKARRFTSKTRNSPSSENRVLASRSCWTSPIPLQGLQYL